MMHVQGYLLLFLLQPSLLSSRYLNFLVLVSMYMMKRIYLWKMRGYRQFPFSISIMLHSHYIGKNDFPFMIGTVLNPL